MTVNTLHPAAYHAIVAAQNFDAWGKDAAERYAVKRGSDARLVRLARQLEAASKAGL